MSIEEGRPALISRSRVQPFTTIRKAGLDLDMTETATMGASYRGQFGSGVQENGFNAKLNVRF
jgi:outer membrane autotransporter protein